jgi:hypothetical protein
MLSSLLLGVAVCVGQTEAPPQAPPPLPAPSPDRWFIMKALQGTYPGWLLDGSRLQLSGWTDASFTASSVTSSNLPMGFNYLANSFALQQNWLRFERTVDPSASAPTWGFRSDWILPGTDYRFTLARGIFNSQLTGDHGQPDTYGIDPIQFYTEAYFPTVGRGLDVKFGRIFCQYGVEVNDAPSNALLSHAYTFIYDPFTHTGVMATLKLTQAWSVQAGMMLGSDVFIDPADEPAGMADLKWAPPSGRNSVLLSVILGSGKFNRERRFNNPNLVDLVYTHQLGPRLAYNFESLAGYQTNVPGLGTATWFSVLNYLTYTFTPRISATTRVEFFDDAQGERTGFKGLYTTLTAGVSLKPHKAIIFRPEVRYDYNNESRPFEDKHGLFTAAGDVILRW